MHPYIPHLLSDIAAAHQDESSEDFYVDDISEDQAFEKHIEEVERYIKGGEPPHTFGYYCGLQTINFPPPEQLESDDLQKVCDAFKQMMETWNLSIDFPDNLPLPMAYSLTVDTLNAKTDIPKLGMRVFDFCSGYAPDCELESYCPCLKFWNEDEEDLSFDMDKDARENRAENNDYLDKDELPF
ncbi:hypothetical protein EI546_13895 [Aequorivita sp. H23M31]|uniref:Uncharacterized protein n=1 Tax=Aequorivita ciconiae TaxID=2494375 RepID=A0A410G6D1_9FLAO|nr:hypothetical protein [Aequorivita sp. H23M31]QAA82745.1 hypothetical protein EI546_13895 [Aequorivita sp. H23M31]